MQNYVQGFYEDEIFSKCMLWLGPCTTIASYVPYGTVWAGASQVYKTIASWEELMVIVKRRNIEISPQVASYVCIHAFPKSHYTIPCCTA